MKPRLRKLPLSKLRFPRGVNDKRPWIWREIGALADDINEHGLVNPIVVRYNPRHSTYTILDGFRRYAACKLLGMGRIPCEVVDHIEYITFNLAEQILR
jgi:ParB/RepB/Spo0J family partition protein